MHIGIMGCAHIWPAISDHYNAVTSSVACRLKNMLSRWFISAGIVTANNPHKVVT
jgi:hypothetical protein